MFFSAKINPFGCLTIPGVSLACRREKGGMPPRLAYAGAQFVNELAIKAAKLNVGLIFAPKIGRKTCQI